MQILGVMRLSSFSLITAAMTGGAFAIPAAPTDLVFLASEADNVATIRWVDQSDDEDAFEFEISINGQAPFLNVQPGEDREIFTFSGFEPGVPVSLRVRAVTLNDVGVVVERSAFSNEIEVITENYRFFDVTTTGTPGEDLTLSLGQDIANFELDSFELITSLPDWLVWDAETRVFTATNIPEGAFQFDFLLTEGVHTREGHVFFNNFNERPELVTAPTSMTLPFSSSIELPLENVFTDPDMFRAALMDTNFGPIRIGFFEGFPITVGNFFSYLETDAWDGTFFHRAPNNFVLQGGGFRPGDTQGTFERIPQFDPIVNEFNPEVPNFSGTISMAKLGGDPDSATNQFFLSVSDNRPILDPQNGGFTVFGRVAGMEAVDRIARLEVGDFDVTIDGAATRFTDLPLSLINDLSPTFNQLAIVNDVVEIPTLTYAVTMTGDTVAEVSLDEETGSLLTISPTGAVGVSTVTLTATDLDGASVSTSFDLSQNADADYVAWASRFGVVNAVLDDDRGSLDNLLEYAFVGDPADSSDDSQILPVTSFNDSGVGLVTFRRRNDVSDIDYDVEVSTDLETWNSVWSTDDGDEAAAVMEVNDLGLWSELTVRNTAFPADGVQFFRVRVISQ